MRRPAIMLFLITAYLLLCSKSCDQGERSQEYRESQAIQHARDSILAEFRTAPPLTENNRALNLAVKSGLTDLISYLNIIGDMSKPSGFREQAERMSAALSESEHITWSVSCPDRLDIQQINISRLMNDTAGYSDFNPIRIPDSLDIPPQMMKENDSIFRGNLIFSYSDHASADQHPCRLAGNFVSFVVVKLPKYFGSDTLFVWRVKFSGNH